MNSQKLLICALLSVFGYSAMSQFSGGSGTINDPYQITNSSELNQIRNYLSANFILLNDIDLTYDTQDPGGLFYNGGEGWAPISSSDNTGFGGRLNGNGYKLVGVKIDRGPINQDYVGFFGNIKGGEVKNLILEDFSVMGNSHVGGLAGISSGAIIDCSISNSSISGSNAGGLVGDVDEGGILRCKAVNVDVGGSFNIGGLAGRNISGAIQKSYSIVSVTGTSTLGGIVGLNNGLLENCYALGTVDGNSEIGGLVGKNDNTGVVRYAYATAAVSATLTTIGGLVGTGAGVVQNSYWNTEESGISTSAGGTPLTSGELRMSSSISGWDFVNTWDIFEDQTYPFLRVFSEDSIPGLIRFLGGDGSSGDPYHVTTPISLSFVRDYPDAYFIQMNDLDLSDETNQALGHFWNDGAGWEPIGSTASPFTGNYNGQGHTVSGLFINRLSEDDIGLFGAVGVAAAIQELHLEGVDIQGGSRVGSLIGDNNGGNIAVCSGSGYVLGGDSTGGLVGSNSGMIMESFTSMVVEGGNITGGLAGFNDGSILFSYTTEVVNGSDKTGGLVGENGSGSIDDSYTTGDVTGDAFVGGFVGSTLSGSTISVCYSLGSVTGNANLGGFTGNNLGTIDNSFWNMETSCNSSSDGGMGKTNEAFQLGATFIDWDFLGTWAIDENASYPFLLWQVSADAHNLPQVIANPAPVVGSLSDLVDECAIEEPTAPKAISHCGVEISATTDLIFPVEDQGITMIIWTYEDAYGNTATQEQKIDITDITAPVPTVVNLPNLTDECSVAEPTAPVATDNCGEVVAGVADVTFPITTQGTIVITWSYEDQQGNISTQTQNAIIDDTTDPIPDVATLPDLIGFCEVLAPTSPKATDNCEGTIEGQANVTFPVTAAGTTVITWTYDDGNGNMATQTQNVIIEDDAAPVPDEATLPDLNGECSLSMPAAPTATDNCDGVIEGVTEAEFPLTESTTITWTFTDANGNISNQTQEVIIADITPPVPNSATLSALTGACVVVRPAAPKATDNCGGVITGGTDAEQLITASTTITWTYTDPSGNTSTQNQEIILLDETAPFPDLIALPDLVGECMLNSVAIPTALDNCDGTVQGTTDTEFPITESTTITWTYTDGDGNSVSQSQNVTINDIDNTVTKLGGVLTASADGYSYQWINCEDNTPVPGATTQDFIASNDGRYAVEISSQNCSILSGCYEVMVLGLEDSDGFQVGVYPNPVSDLLTINNASNKALSIKIINTLGQELSLTTATGPIIQIDVRPLSNGVYFMLMDDGKSEFMKRIVKAE